MRPRTAELRRCLSETHAAAAGHQDGSLDRACHRGRGTRAFYSSDPLSTRRGTGIESGIFNMGSLVQNVSIITLAAEAPRELASFAETAVLTGESLVRQGDTFSHLLVTPGPHPQFELVKVQAPRAPE